MKEKPITPYQRLLEDDAGDVVTLTGEEYDLLMADKERMDWLEKQDCWIGVHGEYEAAPRHACGGGYSDKVRDVCDKNMDA